MAERTFQVDHIHCDGCTGSIRDALERLDGVEEVEPDVATHSVAVAFAESRVDQQAISERLAEAGFPVKDTAAGDAPTGEDGGGSRRWARYGVLTTAVIVVALSGYVGYELYPRFDLPAADGVGLLALAAGAGIASFFAPCSFPLLSNASRRRSRSMTSCSYSSTALRTCRSTGPVTAGLSSTGWKMSTHAGADGEVGRW